MSILGASFYLYETHDEWNEFSREEKLVFNDTQNKPLHQAAVKTVELGLQELKRYLNFSAQKNGKSLVSFILRFQKILSDKIPTCNPAVQRKKMVLLSSLQIGVILNDDGPPIWLDYPWKLLDRIRIFVFHLSSGKKWRNHFEEIEDGFLSKLFPNPVCSWKISIVSSLGIIYFWNGRRWRNLGLS